MRLETLQTEKQVYPKDRKSNQVKKKAYNSRCIVIYGNFIRLWKTIHLVKFSINPIFMYINTLLSELPSTLKM